MKNPIPGSTGRLSLLVEILDWLLAPLILLWPISVVATFWIANSIANIPYDRALRDSVQGLMRQVTIEDGRARVAVPAPVSNLLRSDELDTIYFQIRGLRGEVLAGDRDLAEIFPDEGQSPLIVHFRDHHWHGEPVRIAYAFVSAPQAPHLRVMVQVGETLNKRQALSNEIIAGIIVPQFFLMPFVLVLVWFGLHQGIRPLEELRERIAERRRSDLSPIPLGDVPEEVAPLVESFNGMMRRLEQSMRAEERFIADAAHQMRTPLAGLRMQLEMALRSRDPTESRAALERIAEGVERATRLVIQLLSLARSQGETPPAFAPVNLDALLQRVAREWVEAAFERRIDLGYESAGEGVWVDGHEMMLQELFNNLVDNALRYTPRGGRVTVRVRAGDPALAEIEDSGPGIAERDRDLVFERFYRAGGNDVPGSGLGLAIVRSIAEQHRASVEVKAPVTGQGTLFVIGFPPIPAPADCRTPGVERRAA